MTTALCPYFCVYYHDGYFNVLISVSTIMTSTLMSLSMCQVLVAGSLQVMSQNGTDLSTLKMRRSASAWNSVQSMYQSL